MRPELQISHALRPRPLRHKANQIRIEPPPLLEQRCQSVCVERADLASPWRFTQLLFEVCGHLGLLLFPWKDNLLLLGNLHRVSAADYDLKILTLSQGADGLLDLVDLGLDLVLLLAKVIQPRLQIRPAIDELCARLIEKPVLW